jgi:hypothetical protein
LLVRPLELVAEVRERVLLRLMLHGEQQQGEEQCDETGMHRCARRAATPCTFSVGQREVNRQGSADQPLG